MEILGREGIFWPQHWQEVHVEQDIGILPHPQTGARSMELSQGSHIHGSQGCRRVPCNMGSRMLHQQHTGGGERVSSDEEDGGKISISKTW